MPNTLIGDEIVKLLPRLRRFAQRLCSNTDQADDLVQAACERALAHAAEWRPGTRLDSWMYRIIQNLWRDWLRQSSTRLVADETELTEQRLSVDPLQMIEARSTLSSLDKLIGAMPATQRAVLINVCLKGLTHGECAELLRVPVGTVMSRLARARDTIGRRLPADV